MVATFILTRAFAISALFVGAFPLTHAAPVPNPAPAPSILDTVLIYASRQRYAQAQSPPGLIAQVAPPGVKRSCRQQGCLVEDAEVERRAEIDISTAAGAASAPIAPSEGEDEEKRSCRQVGCLRRAVPVALSVLAPVDTLARRDARGVKEDSGIINAERRSCRQPGCLRELAIGVEEEPAAVPEPVEDVERGALAEKENATEARSCRQVGCLRAV
ncbi:hypothetical protein BC628DRAFT_1418092 [Trametes gibbosa]|nr:hypothetical protein BC628DRAFT_1418092 [Trametes gibbosa]